VNSIKKTARIAGLLYLPVVLTGPFVLIYVPGKLFVTGDAAATAANIVAHQSLFRAHIVVGFIAELLFVAVALTLYCLLKKVSLPLAASMAILVLIDAPLAFLSVANQIATLAFVRGSQFLAAFDKPQRDALAMLLLNVDRQGALVSEVFWGLWLLPLGLLVYRSGFLPRFLGVWLFVNGLAYIAISFTGLFLPHHLNLVSMIATPILLGEVAFVAWLLIVGAREQPSTVAAHPPDPHWRS
jgi:hypothetical protein